MADRIDAVDPQQPPPPGPPPPATLPPPPPPPAQEKGGMTVIDTMPPVLPVAEDPPPPQGCFATKSGLEKCLIILVVIIVVVALIMIIAFLIFYFFLSPPEGTCLTHSCVKSASRIKEHMDADLDPCNSFYDYACHGWSKKQVLGPYEKKLDMETQLDKDHLMKLKALLDVSEDTSDPEFTMKAKSFYKSCLNVEKLGKLGTKPFLDVVSTIGKFPTLDPSWNSSDLDLQDTLMKLARISIQPLFEIQVLPSAVDARRRRLYLSDGELGLGKKEHYVGERESPMLNRYTNWMIGTLVLLGGDIDTAKEDVKDVVDFEISLAKLRRADADKETFTSSYKTEDMNDIQVHYPWIDWLKLLHGITSRPGAGIGVYIGKQEIVVDKEPKYFGGLGTLLEKTSSRVVANYLMSRLLPLTANLGGEFITENEAYAKDILGTKSTLRWKYCADLTAKVYDTAVSRMFVEKYFNKESKEFVTEVVKDVETAFREQIGGNDWMSTETSGQALEKLQQMQTKIGYPDALYDDEGMTTLYKDVTSRAITYMENTVSMMEFEAAENMKKLRKSVDKEEWTVSPTSLEGRYDIKKNELVLPAGFLQTPVYNTDFSSAMNYAGVASIAGREINHGFVESGKMYNAEGNKENWWSSNDEKEFDSRSNCYLKQWGCYKWEGHSMSGEKALGENIAYNAGLDLGYKAYSAMVNRRGTMEQRLPGLKMDNRQVFFVSYAQLWCAKYGDEARTAFIKNSIEPPFPYRVFGTLQNSKAFSRAFSCPVGTNMNPREKCKMW